MFHGVRSCPCSGEELPPMVFAVTSQGGNTDGKIAACDIFAPPVYLGILKVRLFLLQTALGVSQV